MRGLIKNKSLIVSKVKNHSGGYDYVIKNGCKLSEVFNFLPSGIINKQETGIGATTLEIKSKRHSIIIEPLKSTVVQKTQGNKDVFGYLVDNPTVSGELAAYLSNPTIPYKKILLVIDNLERLINDIGDDFLNYFLLFDEIDFMQGSSSYRQRMELGLDISKMHGNFALVSATVIDFSDNYLKKKKITRFSYENKVLHPVKVLHNSNHLIGVQAKRNILLNQLYSYLIHELQNSNDKILVALNSVKKIDKIANSLIKKQVITNSDITLLISDNKYSNRDLY